MKPVIIGQMPSCHEDEGIALPVRSGSSGHRLCQLMEVNETTLRRDFVLMNVSARYDPDGFSPEYHKTEVKNFLPLLSGRKVIMLGPAVAAAFGISRDEYSFGEWFDHAEEHMLICVIPHPSGLNRLYNDPEMQRIVSSLLKALWEEFYVA